MSKSAVLRAAGLPLTAALALALASAGCVGGLAWSRIPIGDGLEVVAADGSVPTIQVLAERTIWEWDGRRAEVRAISGRFGEIRNSLGDPVAGPGIGALLLVDVDAGELRQVIVFGDPGAGVAPPQFWAVTAQEPPADGDWSHLRPKHVLTGVSGIFAGVDAGPRGHIEDARDSGALVVFDLYLPEVLNVAAFPSEAAGGSPVAFTAMTTDVGGLRATATGIGPFDGVRDLRGFERRVAGTGMHAVVDLARGSLTEFTALGTTALE